MQTDIENRIERTISFVKETLEGAEAGHDWFHIERVYRAALHINAQENGDILTISLAALLHDIADSKFNNGDEEMGPHMARDFMQRLEIPEEVVLHVCAIIKNLSYKASLDIVTFSSKELDIVQDADRLDAIGAIGIARAFTYGGYKNRLMYDPAVSPDMAMDKEVYKNSTAPTINHFYEKLLRLKNLMKTTEGKKMAAARHEFMLTYLDHFYSEWAGKS